MTTQDDACVGGETIADLSDALQRVDCTPLGNGMVRIKTEMGPPATRALMRIEAAFLLEDADAMAVEQRLVRTENQRRADAFVGMIEDPGRRHWARSSSSAP